MKTNVCKIFSFLFFWYASFVLLPTSLTASIEWENIGPGGGGYFMSCAIQQDNPNIIYIGSDVAGIHKSIDGGLIWVKKNDGLAASNTKADVYGIENIVIDPNNPKILYIATWNGVFKSNDAAETWKRVLTGATGTNSKSFGALTFDPQDSQIIYAGVGELDVGTGGRGEIYKSMDGGTSWTLLNKTVLPKAVIYGIIIDPQSPLSSRTILAGTGNGVYKSTDGGNSWQVSNTGLPFQDIKRMDSLYSGGKLTVYVLLYSKQKNRVEVYKSLDNGATWINATGNLPNGPFTELVINPDNSETVYAGIWKWRGFPIGVYKSTDGGKSWKFLCKPKNIVFGWLKRWWNQEGGSFLGISPSNPEILLYGENTVFKTTDGGKKWTQTYTKKFGRNGFRGTGLDPTYVYTVAFDPQNSKRYYVGYEDIGLWRTRNGGNFLLFPSGIKKLPGDYDGVSSIAIDPKVTSHIYATVAPSGLCPDEGYPSKFGWVCESTNYGKTWKILNKKGTGLPQGASRLVIDPNSSASSRTLYTAVYNRGIYKSLDGGKTWKELSSGLGSLKKYVWELALNPNSPEILYAGLNSFGKKKGGLYKTVNGGSAWSKIPFFSNYDVIVVLIDKNNPSTLYVGAQEQKWEKSGLFKSTDGGNTWNQIFSEPYVFAAAIHPHNSQNIYVSASQWWDLPGKTNHGLYMSKDGGKNWSKLEGPPHLYILFLGINPLEPDFLYVGTHGGGLFKGRID